jgi:elongator complex protein 4
MSFRKRNIVVSSPRNPEVRPNTTHEGAAAGTRPSPLDGRLTTSTGTRSLDILLAGHAGLAVGNSLLIEENGTTDFAGVLLRYFASEGIVHGHHIHVLGVDESWGRDLPGLAVPTNVQSAQNDGALKDGDKMKIAWRYERLGEFGRGGGSLTFST